MQRGRRVHPRRQHAGRTEPAKPEAPSGGAHSPTEGSAEGAAVGAGAAATRGEPGAFDDGGDALLPALARPPGAAPPQDAPFVVMVRCARVRQHVQAQRTQGLQWPKIEEERENLLAGDPCF